MDWLRLKFASKGEEGSGFSPFRGWRSYQQAKEYGKLVEKAYEKVKRSCVRMPYRRDELEFIFERQRDFLWAKTFFPFAFAVGLWIAGKRSQMLQAVYPSHRHTAGFIATVGAYQYATRRHHQDLVKNRFYVDQVKPGMLKFELEYEISTGRCPTAAEIEDLHFSYFPNDLHERKEIDTRRKELIHRWKLESCTPTELFIILELEREKHLIAEELSETEAEKSFLASIFTNGKNSKPLMSFKLYIWDYIWNNPLHPVDDDEEEQDSQLAPEYDVAVADDRKLREFNKEILS